VVLFAILGLFILLVAKLGLLAENLFFELFRIFRCPRRRVPAVPKTACRKNRKDTQFQNGAFAVVVTSLVTFSEYPPPTLIVLDMIT
jgi:hypothetical protein